MTTQIADRWKTRTWWWWNGPHTPAENARFQAWRNDWDAGNRRPWTGPQHGSGTEFRSESAESAEAVERANAAAKRARQAAAGDDDDRDGGGSGNADAAA
jgi:hypothetical protein